MRNTVLSRAIAIRISRAADYGPPLEHWTITVGLINALFGTYFKVEDWGKMMILDKLARDAGPGRHPDNLDDIVGYAACIDEVRSQGFITDRDLGDET